VPGTGREVNVSKVRETNDWLLTEEIAVPDVPVLVLFDAIEGPKRSETDVAFLAAAARHSGPARFFRVNVDENPSVEETYQLRKLPTLLLFIEGKEIARKSGAVGDKAILEMLTRKQKGP
jgi:thioredoxin-like negative regulator of GroEL